MCKGSKDKFGSIMEGESFQENFQENQESKIGDFCNSSILLELAAADDVFSFQSEVESKNLRLDDVGLWYGRTNGCNCKPKMGFQERTPLMIAALYGSVNVLKFILNAGKVNVNKASGSDGNTALHSAAAGGSCSSVEAVKLLLDAGADPNLTDHSGNKPADLNNFSNFKNLISRGVKSSIRKELGILLTGFCVSEDELFESGTVETAVESAVEFVTESTVEMKKEYPVDVSLPDINDGVYGTDEFRMYMFKVKPCSRAYSHDWTECPFVHPGENARRRDPRKHGYSCVPCPDFRKGSCVKGDGCEYAHGVFESWLHPAQYRTRLCKDETGCARKVCFFAHKVEELRPLYASTGSAVPSPKSSVGLTEMGSMSPMSPLGLGSTPPMSPSAAPLNWQNKNNLNNFVYLTPPALQLPGSRLKTSLHARDLKMEIELSQRQQMIDDLSTNFHNTRFGEFGEFAEFSERKPNNFDTVFGSPSRQQIRPDMDPLRSPYPSSPGRKPAGYGFESSAAVAQAVMNSRASSFTSQRSRSFIDRGAGPIMSPRSMAQSPTYSDWGSRSPDGRIDWGFNSEDANKLRKSASFGIKSGNMGSPMKANREPDDSWAGAGLYSSPEKVPQWVEQMYIEQEQLIV